MIIKYYIDYVNYINEGHIKTYDIDISYKEVLRDLKLLKFDVVGHFHKDKIYLTIKGFNYISKNKIDDLFDNISSILTNRFGWFPSTMNMINIYGMSNLKKYNEDEIKLKQDIISEIEIEYNAKFDEIEPFVPEKLYHLSIQEYESRILKYGLYPKSKSKLSSHIDRIYLCKSVDDCDNLIPKMKLHYSDERDINIYNLGNKKWRKNVKWIIFEINNISNITLYKDPNYIGGYYTLNNIDPSLLNTYSKE